MGEGLLWTKEMNKYSIKILGLGEIRWAQYGETITDEGNTLIHSGPTSNTGLNGVGILIHRSIVKSMITWKPVSD